VSISIDKAYTVGGTGYLQNPDQLGYGYQDDPTKEVRHKDEKTTWHFIAPRVHDFTWAADPDYIHDHETTNDGKTTLHFFYKDKPSVKKNWKRFEKDALKLYDFLTAHIGPYPYKQYSFIQGGDGGMEYAMCTLINGDKKYGSLLGTAAHEYAHTWFQFLLASNESEHPWQDEGFATYISTIFMNEMQRDPKERPFENMYQAYVKMANSGHEEPLTTHADRYKTIVNYSINTYVKVAIFLNQLSYLIWKENIT